MGNGVIKILLAIMLVILTLISACHEKFYKDQSGLICPTEPQFIMDTSLPTSIFTIHEVRFPDIKIHVKRGQTLAMKTNGLMLTAVNSAIQHEAIYSVTSLTSEELPELSRQMVNMTAAAAGYLLLPDGEHFQPYAELRVEYDPERLPQGYTPDDIYTSFYDSASMAWVRLERIKVDTVTHEVVSVTTHFSNFINELTKVPKPNQTKSGNVSDTTSHNAIPSSHDPLSDSIGLL